jgi:hypothetical protein
MLLEKDEGLYAECLQQRVALLQDVGTYGGPRVIQTVPPVLVRTRLK